MAIWRNWALLAMLLGCLVPPAWGDDQEVTIKGVFHHTPWAVKRALDLIAQGAIDTSLMVTHEFPLARIAEVVDFLVRQEGIKIAVVP